MADRFLLKSTSILLNYNYLRKKAKVNPLIINYHVVSDLKLPYIKHLYGYRSISEFQKDIEFYQSNYRIIGLPDLLDWIKRSKPLPDNSLLLTFDDGFREIYETVAPHLLDKKVPATFFLTSSFIDNCNFNHDNKQSLLVDIILNNNNLDLLRELEKLLIENNISGNDLKSRILAIPYHKRHIIDQIAEFVEVDLNKIFGNFIPYLTSNQVSELIHNGFTIGSHSIDHARFIELSLVEQIMQTVTSIDFLTEKFGLDYRVFAFPYTDIGVSNSFFESIEKQVDITFGTQGLMDDPISFNLQRINGEKYPYSAKRNIKSHYFTKIVKSTLNRNTIVRK
ncbi:MAG: polysaccharide deacetylase family protein [Bacteroidales bacterium]